MPHVAVRVAGYLLAAAVVVMAAVLLIFHVKREALALALANDALAASGFSVTDLAIARLRPDEIHFARLLLEQEDGAQYDLRDLRIPLSLPNTTMRAAAIGRVSVLPAPAAASEPPPAYGEWLETALALPERLPERKVTVGIVEWPGWPAVTDVEWVSGEASQAVSARVGTTEVRLQTARADAATHRLTLQVRQGPETLVGGDNLEITRADGGQRIRGTLALGFSPLLARVGDHFELPAGLEAVGSGVADVVFSIETDGAGSFGVDATLDLDPGASMRYRVSDDLAVEARAQAPVRVSARYPSRDWEFAAPALSLRADHPAATAIEFTVLDVDCTAKGCRLNTKGLIRAADTGFARVAALHVAGDLALSYSGALEATAANTTLRAEDVRGQDWQLAELAFTGDLALRGAKVSAVPASLRAKDLHGKDWKLGELAFGGAITLDRADDWALTIVPASLRLSNVRGDNWGLASAELAGSSGASLRAAPASLRIAAERLVLDLGQFAADRLSADARVRLDAFSLDMGGPTLASRFALPKDRLRVTWDDLSLVPADLEGRMAFTGTSGRIAVAVADAARALSARIDIALAPERISATMEEAALDFGSAPLSASFGDWPHAWDLALGSARATGEIEWRGPEGTLTGAARLRLLDAAGLWDDLAATGIQADVPLALEAGRAPVIGPALISAGYLDVGLPLEDLAAAVRWDMANPVVDIADFSLKLLGGTLRAAPFGFDIDRLSGSTVLHVKGVQLGLIPALAEFESVELTGALSGTVPVEVDNGQVTVAGGRLENDAPGGVIRYHAQAAPDSGSALGLAQRALSNLQYDSLTSDVTYDEEGDLVLNLRLKGVNPDLDPLQPVILNLNVENNVPELLESLQATRDIQDVIERRTRKPSAELSP